MNTLEMVFERISPVAELQSAFEEEEELLEVEKQVEDIEEPNEEELN